jgi:hypothetical protein
MDSYHVAAKLLELRRDMAWKGMSLGEFFHATTDAQVTRDAVFAEICQHEFHVQATIMEKSKAQPQVRLDKPTFYKYGWYFHFKHGVARQLPYGLETLVTAATIGTRRERAPFEQSVDSVLAQVLGQGKWRTDFVPAASDPCVQVADYCAWAIQRKYERADERSYNLIKHKINYEYDLWSRGQTHYY